MRVLHVVSSTGYAGIERHVVALSAGLRAGGVDSAIACRRTARRLRREARAAAVPVTGLDAGIGRTRPQIVHAHDGIASLLAWPLAAAARARFVRTQHFIATAASLRSGWARSTSLALHRTIGRSADATIAVSHVAAGAALARGETTPAAVTVIGPGALLADDTAVDAARRARAGKRSCVLYLGRLEADKRVDALVAAVPHVLARVPDCRFVVAGSGSLGPALRAQARSLGIGHAVSFPGEVPDSGEALAGAHVYANPSFVESFGIATAEAMGYALPVVGMAAGGTAELVEHGATGLLVEGGDPAAFGAAIAELAGAPERAARLGAAARERALAHFGMERTVEQTAALYQRLAVR